MYREILKTEIERDIVNIKRQVDIFKPELKRLMTDKYPVKHDYHIRAIGSFLSGI